MRNYEGSEAHFLLQKKTHSQKTFPVVPDQAVVAWSYLKRTSLYANKQLRDGGPTSTESLGAQEVDIFFYELYI